jgi:uncharacterized protein (DUF305 family)
MAAMVERGTEDDAPAPAARRAAGGDQPADDAGGGISPVDDAPDDSSGDEAAGEVSSADEAAGDGGPGAHASGDGVAGGLSWGRVAVLGLALAFLGFAAGLFLTRDRPPGPTSADVGFVQDMLTHHDQALGVAVLTAAYGEDPTVRSFAIDVIAFQQYEIGVMTRMLDEWGYSRAERSDQAMAWMGMPVPVEQMPGLLTEEQLDEINEARGSELDRLFLEHMAEHHRGGLHMAQEGARLAEDDDVAALAARIERNQAAEINEYRHAADELGLGLDIAPASVPPADLPAADG